MRATKLQGDWKHRLNKTIISRSGPSKEEYKSEISGEDIWV